MPKVGGAVFNFDQMAEMINYISDIAEKEYGIYLTKEARLETVEYLISHYHDHAMAYAINVTGADPYKFIAWAGVHIYEELHKTNKEEAIKFLSSSIAALNRVLIIEKRSVPEWYLRKALQMVISEYANKGHIGLGKNGLYMAFKGAALVSFDANLVEE